MTGKKKLAKAGKYSGGSQPFGYRWDDEKDEWVIREDEAKIVKLIFQWYVYGDESGQPLGMVRIAEKLTELGIPTPNQFRVSKNTLDSSVAPISLHFPSAPFSSFGANTAKN